MSLRSWHALGAGKFCAQSAPVSARYATPFLALSVAAAALSARSLNASFASPIGMMNVRTTKALQHLESQALSGLLVGRGDHANGVSLGLRSTDRITD